MKHHHLHQHYQVRAAKLHSRAQAALDFLCNLAVATAIGIGMAALLVAWWSS